MADMIDDVGIGEGWVNLATASGLVGVAMTVQNKGVYPILIMVKSVIPVVGSSSGFRIRPNETWTSAVGDTVWARSEVGTSAASIQGA